MTLPIYRYNSDLYFNVAVIGKTMQYECKALKRSFTIEANAPYSNSSLLG